MGPNILDLPGAILVWDNLHPSYTTAHGHLAIHIGHLTINDLLLGAIYGQNVGNHHCWPSWDHGLCPSTTIFSIDHPNPCPCMVHGLRTFHVGHKGINALLIWAIYGQKRYFPTIGHKELYHYILVYQYWAWTTTTHVPAQSMAIGPSIWAINA